jgi:hypothetical protein
LINHAAFRDNFCPLCEEHFTNTSQLEEHFFHFHPLFYTHQVGAGGNTPIPINLGIDSFGGAVRQYDADLTGVEIDDVNEFFQNVEVETAQILGEELNERRAFKVFFSSTATFSKSRPDGEVETMEFAFRSFAHTVFNNFMIGKTIQIVCD